jgi:uncharacterized protein YdhG (YjbR/CyaY superfamily)
MNVIDEYMSQTSDENKRVLQHIRKLVHAQVPDVEECLSYGMPGFRMRSTGKIVLGFAINKKSLSIYPHSGQVLSTMKSDVSPWQSAKSALQFSATHPIPDDIIKEFLAVRVQEILDGYGTKK